jgi:hypothetical protein
MSIRVLLLLCATAVLLTACGVDGELVEKTPVVNVVKGTQPLSAGTYKLTFSALSTARLATSISGIDVTVKLPSGLSVATVSGASGQVLPTSIIPGNVNQSILGNYSASTRTVYLAMITPQDTYRSGQFMNLLFTVQPGSSVTPDDILALNSTFSNYKVVGWDVNSYSSVILTGSVKTTLGVER